MTSTKWSIDPAHSEIQFKVKHLMITTVTGHFSKFEGEAETEGNDFSTAKILVKIDAASVSTGNEQRDGHMKSADFLEPEKYPDLTFRSSRLEKTAGTNSYDLSGDLTIKDVTRPIKLAVDFGGMEKDPWGNTKAGFTVTGKLNRKDWGLNWNAALESGGVLVSDEVKIACEVQFVKSSQQ